VASLEQDRGRPLARACLNRLATSEAAGVFARDMNAGGFAKRVLDDPAGAYVWSEVGSRLTKDPERELAHLYERFIGGFEESHSVRRSDADIWRPARDRLIERLIEMLFKPKTIRTEHDEAEFPHAWKNGVWHCIQPLSFDLADAGGIKEKAARWVGHRVGLAQASDAFHPYFLFGRPSQAHLLPDFERAVAFLSDAPGHAPARVVREEDVNGLVDEFAEAVREHVGAGQLNV
jgi:hypothetical protein